MESNRFSLTCFQTPLGAPLHALLVCFFLLKAASSLPLANICGQREDIPHHSGHSEQDRFETQVQQALVLKSQNFSVLSSSGDKSVKSQLFGNFRSFAALPRELRPFQHPRVVFGRREWNELLAHHTESRRHGSDGSWSTYFERQTVWQGPLSEIIAYLAELEQNGLTDVYDGRPMSGMEFETYRNSLKPLSTIVEVMNSSLAPSFLLCSFWTGVSTKLNQDFLPVYNSETCVKAMVAWSKILLAHRIYHCTPNCPLTTDDKSRSFLWNSRIPWKMRNDDYTAGLSLSLAYDTLYNNISPSERRVIRSALALLVMNRFSWGICPVSSEHCPDVFSDPHKIVDVNAMYHTNLFLTNLAIEGEFDFDAYTNEVLRENRANGFNSELHVRYLKLLRVYMDRAVYLDGSPVQDNRFYTEGLREGSLAFVALQRRGLNLLDTPKFRNLILYASQVMEPWECGRLPGESPEATHNTFIALFNFLYPESEVVSIMWRQRMGSLRPKSCARFGWRSICQMLFLAREPVSLKNNYNLLPNSIRGYFLQNAYYARRGLLVARTGLGNHHAHLILDIRSDVVLSGRDSGGRGDVRFAVGGHTWLKSFGSHSTQKSLLHIDGVAQEEVAPPANLIRLKYLNNALIAVADLTYSYNVQWARGRKEQLRYITAFDQSRRTSHRLAVLFSQKETHVPFSNISIPSGLEERIWKRKIRVEQVTSVVRSVCLLSGGIGELDAPNGVLAGALIISDYVAPGRGSHRVESYLALSSGTSVLNLSCSRNPNEPMCAMTLVNRGKKKAILHIVSNVPLRAKVEVVRTSFRIIVSTEARRPIRIWTGIAIDEIPVLKMRLLKEGLIVVHGKASSFFHGTTDGGIDRAKQKEPITLRNGDYVLLNATSMKPVLKELQTFEANVIIAAESVKGMDDVISTCGHKTSTRTRIHVFFCKNTTSDDPSRCNEMPGFRSPCSKASGREEWRGQLQQGNQYNVHIAVESIDGLRSVVEIRYRLRRHIADGVHR